MAKEAKPGKVPPSMNEEKLEAVTKVWFPYMGVIDRLLLFALFDDDTNVHMIKWAFLEVRDMGFPNEDHFLRGS